MRRTYKNLTDVEKGFIAQAQGYQSLMRAFEVSETAVREWKKRLLTEEGYDVYLSERNGRKGVKWVLNHPPAKKAEPKPQAAPAASPEAVPAETPPASPPKTPQAIPSPKTEERLVVVFSNGTPMEIVVATSQSYERKGYSCTLSVDQALLGSDAKMEQVITITARR